MKRTKVIILLIALLFMSFIFAACGFWKYYGDYADLYTVAVCNIFGASGYRSNGEAEFDPIIKVIETDNYGRTLFFYEEGEFYAFGHAIVIMQKSDEEYVYYYQDDCYLPYYNVDEEYHSDFRDYFSDEDIETLKERNDWNNEINVELCTKTQIIRRKNDGNLDIKKKEFEEVIKPYVAANGYKGNDNIYRYSEYCNSDIYGRELYYVAGVGRDVDGTGVSTSSKYQDYNFAIIFNPDKSCPSCNICEIPNTSTNYWEVIKSLKETANWNQPYPTYFEE